MRMPHPGFLILAALAALVPAQSPAASDLVQRGEYLAHIMDCNGCHTPGALKGAPEEDRYLAGSETGFEVPGVGVAYPPNLTPDPETGLGEWSVREIMRAIRQGTRPDGSPLAPPMPWPGYSDLTDRDARALAAFLKTLPPVEHATPPRVADPAEADHPFLTLRIPD